MHILLFILIFIIAIFVFGLSIIGFILRTIFTQDDGEYVDFEEIK